MALDTLPSGSYIPPPMSPAARDQSVPRIAPQVHARPFLKWAGGKGQLAQRILATFPKHFGTYHEPFVGGGAMFFALRPDKATLSDINLQLMMTYAALRDDVDKVIDRLLRLEVSKENFYRVRAQNPRRLSRAGVAARVIFLNKTCFNGLYRVNRRGEFNVPFGYYTQPKVCDADNLRRVSLALRNVRLRCQDAGHLPRQVRRGDLVYFDPPYVPVSRTSNFIHYAQGGFDAEAQVRLAHLFGRLAKRGVHVVLSNADTPFVRRLYAGFDIQRFGVRRAINCQGQGRGAVYEVVVSAIHAAHQSVGAQPQALAGVGV